MEAIRFESLSFRYPLSDKDSLSDITLSVDEGEFIVLIGRSGCGKSTLLKHLKKNLTPYGRTTGSVRYKGTEVSELDDRVNASEIGFVRQDTDNQIVTDKVWHELAFGPESLGMDNNRIRRRVAEVSSYFGITSWIDEATANLSGGQKQLLNLASVMITDPKLLILDEPTAQLDPVSASAFLRTVARINRELGVTVIMSEHRLEEVFSYADRVIYMDEGKIEGARPPEKIAESLKGTEFFAALPAVTRIHAAVSRETGSPVNIREGRAWLNSLLEQQEARPFRYEEDKRINPAAVTMKGVSFRYGRGEKEILKDTDVYIEKGRINCILGGNGSGKSTLLKVIAGIEKPQRGRVDVKGKAVMLPQNPKALFSEITCEDELIDAGNDPQKVREIMKLMEIEGHEKTNPYDLSGGEEERLAIGKVLMTDPDILLLDEPTKGLDAVFKATLGRILTSLVSEGRTVVMVSHDIEFAASYADRCSMMFDGDVMGSTDPHEFFSGNDFYTTAANRLAGDRFPGAVTAEEVVSCMTETT